MHPSLQHNLYFVKEHLGLFKAANNFDVLDPNTGEEVLHCREPNLGLITKLFRFSDYKRMTPFDIHITTPQGEPVIEVRRGFALAVSQVSVFDESSQPVGGFKQKFFSLGGKFDVLDYQGNPLCTLQGKWTSWEFSFKQDDVEYAKVTKKWGGLGKELFTSADNYVLQIADNVPPDHPLRILIMAAVMCIDMVLKE